MFCTEGDVLRDVLPNSLTERALLTGNEAGQGRSPGHPRNTLGLSAIPYWPVGRTLPKAVSPVGPDIFSVFFWNWYL